MKPVIAQRQRLLFSECFLAPLANLHRHTLGRAAQHCSGPGPGCGHEQDNLGLTLGALHLAGGHTVALAGAERYMVGRAPHSTLTLTF